MNETILLVIGIILILSVSIDLVYTTFSPRGAGLISSTIATLIWRSIFWTSRYFNYKKILTVAGVIIVMSVLVGWVLLLWAGNVLIYLSDTEAVVNTTTKVPADLAQRVYFTGYTLSTLGNGDFAAGSDGWRIYSSFISFSGLIMITIGISYMVPVLSAVTARRAISIRIASIGHSPQEMLLNNWDGKDFKMLNLHFNNLAQPLAEQGQMHLAYPVLHFFHHTDKVAAILPNVAALDEAITLLLLFVPEDKRPSDQALIPLRQAITTFLGSLTALFLEPETVTEPSYDISKLQAAGIPIQKPDLYRISKLSQRRRTLQAMLLYDGWEWEEICAPILDSNMDLPEML
ncbi:potassium channel family protein [Pontibacter akesuensis]|uniref:Potassium channel domain-containing protein n=1 Tax=Pontibacter akesuensis TaxID=388950 RepID=A0A1I7G412_9BACT|nr:potassium channel family protein [Pontibacter akesuensis]GHA58958.1 putative membrane protein YdjJ [Pontibacter akesuensis]SFU43180.1 hypothetical protein SAMN04487941_0700 [Pontibacter akesuensis]